MAPPLRRRVRPDVRAADRVLLAPAVLRPGPVGRQRQVAPLVHLVPHTHWDREWYLPFQSFRLRLVRLIDKVLDRLEADERMVFTLDGQLQTVDDYLEVRPGSEERIRALVESGRLAVGPWQVLMDEFLVSGETIWRNLEAGLARADELGGAMRVGYLPDMFGHVAQMPQILRSFDLDVAVVWRGVPRAIDRHVFSWSGLDGSTVRAEYLPDGYGNGAYLLAVPDGLARSVEALADAMRPFFGDDPVLAMYGTDHMEPVPELVDLVERCNAENGTRIELKTLAGALGPDSERSASGLSWTGEMRSGARANVLMNVTSARMDIKAAAARAERALERYAEPFAELHGGAWPQEFLDLAWRRVIENSAHDSVCGCSADAVSAQVLIRYAEATQIADELTSEALAEAVEATPRGAVVVANPSPFPRSDLVEVELPVPEEWGDVVLELADGTQAPTQELERNVPQLHRAELLGREIVELLGRRLHGRELFGRQLNGFRTEEGPRLILDLDTEQDPLWLDVAQLRQEIEVAANAKANEHWNVLFRTRPRRRLLAEVPTPPLGWVAARAGQGEMVSRKHDVTADRHALDNGLVRFAVDEAPRIVRGFDAGDSYNYAPPAEDVLVDDPQWTEVEVLETGPLRARVLVTRTYTWPPGHSVPVETLLELRAGEPFVRVRIAFENPAVDQRVRAHVALPREASHTYAEGQYAVVEREPQAEGGHGEVPLPTFPACAFVAAGGVAILLDHVSEYELLDGRELALTVLRSTGWISRNTNPYREDPAGPEVAIPDAQMRGPWSFAFGVYAYDGDRPGPDVLAQAEHYRLPFIALAGVGEPGELSRADGFTVEGEGVVLAALRRRNGAREFRVVNQTPDERSALVDGVAVELRPWEIRTLS